MNGRTILSRVRVAMRFAFTILVIVCGLITIRYGNQT